MRSLPLPTLVARDVFRTCISKVADAALKARLTAITDRVAEASEEYALLADLNALHMMTQELVVDGVVSRAEMDAVYSLRMARKGAPGRVAYDELFNSAPLDKCPLCCQRKVATLDHHLPKARYPALAVAPLNLVPACSDCNKSKLAAVPTAADEEALHPYFDNVSADRWLSGDVIVGSPAAVVFRVEPPAGWDAILVARLERHFRMLRLGSLYSFEAANEISNIRHQLARLHETGGMECVREELQDRANSCRAASLNSWQTATFDAFVASDWFCDGGFC